MEEINHPERYSGNIECVDAIESATKDLNGLESFCIGNAIKYLWRYRKKNGVQDLMKAKWYIDKVIDILKDNGGKK